MTKKDKRGFVSKISNRRSWFFILKSLLVGYNEKKNKEFHTES